MKKTSKPKTLDTFKVEFPDGTVLDNVTTAWQLKAAIHEHVKKMLPNIKMTSSKTGRSFVPDLRFTEIKFKGQLGTQMKGVSRNKDSYIPDAFRPVCNTLMDIALSLDATGSYQLPYLRRRNRGNIQKLTTAQYIVVNSTNVAQLTDKARAYLDKIKNLPAAKVNLSVEELRLALKSVYAPNIRTKYDVVPWANLSKRWMYVGLLEHNPSTQQYALTAKGLEAIQKRGREIAGLITYFTRSWPNKPIEQLFTQEDRAFHKVLVSLIPKTEWPVILSESDSTGANYLTTLIGIPETPHENNQNAGSV